MSKRPNRRKPGMNSGPGNSSRKFEEGLPITAKKQILGFFLIIFSIFLILSIVSYSPNDQYLLEKNTHIWEIFKKENPASSYNISNWLGIIGVYISGFLVENSFGYFSFFIPMLLIIYGFLWMRKKYVSENIQFSIYSILLMVFLSAFGGLLYRSLGQNRITYAIQGRSGEYLSTLLYQLIGSFASYMILTILIISAVFLALDRNFFKTLARLKLLYENLKEKYKKSVEEAKERKKLLETEIKREGIRSRVDKEAGVLTRNKKTETEEPEEHVIKDTNINRPVEEISVEKNKAAEINEPELKIEKKVKPAEKHDTKLPDGEKEETVKPEKIEGTIIDEELDEYVPPPLDLLDEPLKEELELISDEELKENGKLLQNKLLNFDVRIDKVIATPGPVVTLYELIPAEDVKLSKIESLQDDIALALKAKGIRMIIPIPGKGTVGVEIPNHNPCMVKIRSVIGSKKFNDSSLQLPLALGKTISGEVLIDDLAKMPHLLIAGSTGSGKSVGINTIITSLLYKLKPSDLKFILIDPKKIELNLYSKLRRHYLAVSKDIKEAIVTTPQNAVLALKGVELEMEKRYERLANATVRNIFDYNKKWNAGLLKNESPENESSDSIKHGKMPYLVVIIDELADLMMTAAREVEDPIARLAQLARAVGIHLVLATQRPSVDVITGVIKANFSARIAYLVNSKVDSRTILDMNGAETLLGNGDMLYLPPGVGKPLRIQNPFISADEVDKLTDYIKGQKGFSRDFELPSVNTKKKNQYGTDYERDELFEDAARLIVRTQQGSTSFLQRRLKIGYARAARIVDELEEAGVVGPFDGSKQREVLVDSEAQLEQLIQI
jgi:S-DNA-T family DNA segregation ATPase FtsK/SpoIIIE